MRRRYGPVVRLVGLALLLLAMSPLTAPFSTCDPLNLFDGATTPAPVSVQSKIQADEPAAEVGVPIGLHPIFGAALFSGPAKSSHARGFAPLDVPLRL